MKKSLLLSVVASGLIYAGGDIAPVAPVTVPTVAPAACDFYGSIGVRYQTTDKEFHNEAADTDTKIADLFDRDNSELYTTAVLGVKTQLAYGFGIGAEVAGTMGYSPLRKAGRFENSEISELYLTYKYNNTAFKFGRQALPQTLSPWAWTDTTVGKKDITFEGLVVVNTDIADTTLVGAWIANAVNGSTIIDVNGKDNAGLFMLAAEYNGIANTTLRASLYYVTKDPAGDTKTSAWASAETKLSNFDLGLQVAYAKTKGTDATTGVAGYIGTNYSGFDAKLTLAYIKDGATSFRGAGLGAGSSAFWGDVGYAVIGFGGDTTGTVDTKQKIAKLDLGYKLPSNSGKIYGGVAYDDFSSNPTFDKALAARIGYSFKVNKIAAKVEYRYTKVTYNNKDTDTRNRVRVEGIYKF